MRRRIMELQPTEMAGAAETAAEKLKQKLRGIGDVREPGEAEEPILAKPVRAAIMGWLAELRAREELEAVGIKPRSTALLSGPPGCGKTTLAHHLAARLGIPLVTVGSESIFSSGLGDSERNVAKLFDGLDAADAPCVVLLDEIEAIGTKRATEFGAGGANQARNSTLTVLLRKIEAFDGILIGATNLSTILDPALWRRFGMQIEVELPDDDARFAILKRYGAPFEFGDDAIELLTELCDGAAPSLLRQMMEGVKRLLILGDRLGQPAASPEITFSAVIGQAKPHPDYDPPPLWAKPDLVRHLAGMPWPPARTER